MRKVPVITGANRKNSHAVEDEADRDRWPGDAAPERAEAGEMDQHKGQRRGVHDVGVRAIAHAIGINLEVAHGAGVLYRSRKLRGRWRNAGLALRTHLSRPIQYRWRMLELLATNWALTAATPSASPH